MARHSPIVFIKDDNVTKGFTESIVSCEGVFFVTFQGKAFNKRLVRQKLTVNGMEDCSSKYPRTTFVNSGHAFLLANKLNEYYECDDFAVHQVTASVMLKPATWVKDE